MKKLFKRFFIKILCVALTTVILSDFTLREMVTDVHAEVNNAKIIASMQETQENRFIDGMSLLSNAKEQTLYVKDVIFITAESKEEAKNLLPNGYIMVEDDLNKGAEVVSDVDDVYLAYATTTNPDEAITDIKMMNMKGGFVVSDYETDVQNLSENVQNMVHEFADAVKAFVANYKKGTNGAKAAYRTLSAFFVDEENKNLADYLVYSNVPDSFYLKLLLNAHTDVISAILSALTMAVQGEPGNTWIDRLCEIEDPYEITNSIYWDKSVALIPHFISFFDTYDSIDHDLFRGAGGPLYFPPDDSGNIGEDFSYKGTNPSVDLTGGEFYYELAHLLLEQYSFGDGTLISDWLVCSWIYEEMLYPLIEVLTPAEYAMMHLCGPLYMILATGMSDAVYSDYIKQANEIIKDMGNCSVWVGVNTDLLRSSVGITDEACQAIAETKVKQELNDQGDNTATTVLYSAGLLAAAGLAALGTGVLLVNFFGSSLFAGFVGTAAVAVSCKAAVVASITGVFCSAAGVVGMVVALVVAVVYLVSWLVDWIAGYYPELTECPKYMYEYVTDDNDNAQFVLYEAAKNQNGKPADVNAKAGSEWHAPYISRNKAAGAPIKADFIVKYGDGRIDDGYAGLSRFGNINCENLNSYAFDDDVGGIFVTYRQEDLEGNYARGKYLSGAKLFTAENEELCKINLKNEKYTLYNLNLTPNANYYTYLGYKTTNNASSALTDMRFAYAYSSTQYNAGGANLTYAASGTVGDITLYITRISKFGSPIYSDFKIISDMDEAPEGYEPVNMFSGGSAVNINASEWKYIDEDNPYYFYFLPSKAYVKGTEYIGGISMMYDTSWGGYFNGEGSVSKAAADMKYNVLATMKGKGESSDTLRTVEGAVLYTTTYNPYRAIYDVGAMATGGEMGSLFSEMMMYRGKGYSLATRYVVDHNDRVLYDSNIRSNDSRLYVAGPAYGGTPLKPGDVIATSVMPENPPEGYRAISAFLSTGERPANVTSGLNYYYVYGYGAGKRMYMNMSPLYMFVRGKAYEEGSALSSIQIESKEQVLNGQEVECDLLDNSYVMTSLAAKGVHTVVNKNLNLADSDNATYLGYAKDGSVKDPITDMFLYYAGETDKEPNLKYTKNNIEYHLVSSANIFCYEDYETKTCKRVYLYTTTNPAAGSPVLDITIDNNAIVDGWETVRTQNGKALYDDMDEYSGDMWFIHMKRTTEDPKYISEIVVGWGSDAEAKAMLLAAGCDYMLQKDFNAGVGILSDYVYLGYKRTSDPTQAIRNIISVHNEDYETFKKNGATYHKVEGNLNSYTNYFADDIYLFYTKDSKAGSPLISLGTSGSEANWSHGEGGRYVVKTVLDQNGKPSDLNDGALGDYIYLLQTRDKEDANAIASMIGNGSVIVIIACTMISVGVILWLYFIQKKRDVKGENHLSKSNEKRE